MELILLREPLPQISELLLEAFPTTKWRASRRQELCGYPLGILGGKQAPDPEQVYNGHLNERVNGCKQNNHIPWYLSGSLKTV